MVSHQRLALAWRAVAALRGSQPYAECWSDMIDKRWALRLKQNKVYTRVVRWGEREEESTDQAVSKKASCDAHLRPSRPLDTP